MMVGIFTLYCGTAVVLIGVVALSRYCWQACRMPKVPRRRVWFSTFAGAGLLLLNFPVAGGIVAAAIALETRYTVIVQNDSLQPLESVRVFGGGCDESLGTIPPGSSVRRSFWIQHDGELEFYALGDDTSYEKIINGYVTNGLGGHTIVTIRSDGTMSLSSNASWLNADESAAYVSKGSCPFECCAYGDWPIVKDVEVYERPSLTASAVDLDENSEIEILDYIGEGYSRIRQGSRVNEVKIARTKKRCAERPNRRYCWAEVIREPLTVWWVQLGTNTEVSNGWIKMEGSLSPIDECG